MKKGFTLIELLSVIIILAVITLIAVPIVSGVITKVKLGALKSSAYGLLEASDLYYSQYSNTKSVRFDIDDNNVLSNDTTNLLSYKGEVKEGTVIINKKGETTLCITDGTNSVYKNYKDKKVIEAANKKCNIPSSTYVVYLDDTATLNEYSNEELTNIVTELQEEVNRLKSNKADQTDLETLSTVAGSSTLDKMYPVGSIYLTTTEDTTAKVQTKFGGTWVKIEDRFLLAAGSTYTAGNIGGSATNSHTHSVTAAGTVGSTTLTTSQIPSHYHYLYGNPHVFAGASSATGIEQIVQMGIDSGIYWNGYWGLSRNYTASAGGGGSHDHTFTGTAVTSGTPSDTNNMPPYLVVYVYKRTA